MSDGVEAEAARPKRRAPKRSAAAIVATVFVVLLNALFWASALLLPLVGAWLLSSLIAFANGPVWLAFVALFALFPILPGAWEGVVVVLRRRKGAPRERVLTLGDRLLLRTLALNVVFVGGLLLAAPETGVRALLTRGDWMLDGSQSKAASKARDILFAVADRFAWIYQAAHPKSYDDGSGEAKRRDNGAKEAVRIDRSIGHDRPATTNDRPDPPREPAEEKPVPIPEIPIAGGHAWPEPEVIDPITVGLEPDSIDALGAALHDETPDEYHRIKAIHDWIADRVNYDFDAFFSNRFPPQDAQTVFRTHVGVCAGYANLFVAIARAAKLEAVVVAGDAKGANGEVDGRGHAWNAVKADGKWYLVDTTWDAGSLGDDRHFKKKYRTDYLFTPPEIFRGDHFPREDKWQLMSPIGRGDFMRLPQMEPSFYKRGMKLVGPTRSQTSVGATGTVTVDNPSRQFMMVGYMPKGATGESTPCEVTGTITLEATCRFPAKGEYRVVLYGASEQYTTYWSMGELEFLSDP